MPMEHRRPNGSLSQGYFCTNCGMPCGLYGHSRPFHSFPEGWNKGSMYDCIENPKLVKAVRAANPVFPVKPHFKLEIN